MNLPIKWLHRPSGDWAGFVQSHGWGWRPARRAFVARRAWPRVRGAPNRWILTPVQRPIDMHGESFAPTFFASLPDLIAAAPRTIVRRYMPTGAWMPGPWDTEPDRADWDHAGLQCRAVRNNFGSWCGYVGVDETHPLYGVGYDAVEDIEAHGGLTFTGPHYEAPPDRLWWFGFDCGHHMDYMPGLDPFHRGRGKGSSELFAIGVNVYRDLAYVRAEVDQLADQLAARGRQ